MWENENETARKYIKAQISFITATWYNSFISDNY